MNNYKELIVAVIKSGVADKDEDYFNSSLFEEHCFFLGIKEDDQLEAIREKCLTAIRGKKHVKK